METSQEDTLSRLSEDKLSPGGQFMVDNVGYKFQHIDGTQVDHWEVYWSFSPKEIQEIYDGTHEFFKRMLA